MKARNIAVVTAAACALGFGGVALANEVDREKAAENFLQADAGGDGLLTFGEFVVLIDLNAEDDLGRARMIQRFGRYEMAFEKADGDGDQIVTKDELASLAASMN